MKSSSKFKRPLLLLLFAAAAFGFFFLGRFTALPRQETPEATVPVLESAPEITRGEGRYLRLDAEENAQAEHSRYFPDAQPEALSLYYLGLEDVRIFLEGQSYFLEDALNAGLLSGDDLTVWANLDASLGNCTAYSMIRSGVPLQVFRYPEYELRFAYAARPDSLGGWDMSSRIYICANLQEETAASLNAPEDWGLDFEVQSADSTGITLLCTQSGGQVLDSLIVERYYISTPDFSESFPRQDGEQDTSAFEPFPAISRNSQTQIGLDWSTIYGDIPPGEYILNLKVSQVYDPENRTADRETFTARQSYLIPFTVSG